MNNIEERYNKMVASIEHSYLYDGRGTYDEYECEACSKKKITTYDAKGVTPYMIKCECGSQMIHVKSYRNVPSSIKVEKFVRPTLEQLKNIPEGRIGHVLNGGLILESEL